MIVKTHDGQWEVKSESIGKNGKRKSFGKYNTLEAAKRRLAQILMFKKMKKE